MSRKTITVKEIVSYTFNVEELDAALQQTIESDPELEKTSTRKELEEWFCDLNNPFAEADISAVTDRKFV